MTVIQSEYQDAVLKIGKGENILQCCTASIGMCRQSFIQVVLFCKMPILDCPELLI